MKKLCMSGVVLIGLISGCASNESLPMGKSAPSTEASLTKLPQQGGIPTRRDDLQNVWGNRDAIWSGVHQ